MNESVDKTDEAAYLLIRTHPRLLLIFCAFALPPLIPFNIYLLAVAGVEGLLLLFAAVLLGVVVLFGWLFVHVVPAGEPL